jgi:Predicted membrane protein
MRELLAISWQEFLLILGAFRTIWEELLEIRFTGPRALRSTMTTLSTSLSVTAALALHMDYVWWAAMSGFMATQATRPGSIQRALLRIVGTWPGSR